MMGRDFSVIATLFFKASSLQKKRAILTVAAIAWGSLSLVLLLGFGDGLSLQLELASAGLGRDIAIFWPGETTKPWQGLEPGREIRPKIEDIKLVVHTHLMYDHCANSKQLPNARFVVLF